MPVTRACSHCGQKYRIPAKYLASTGRCGICKSSLPPVVEPIAIDDALFDEVVQNFPIPVLVDFWRNGAGLVAQLLLRSHEPLWTWRARLLCSKPIRKNTHNLRRASIFARFPHSLSYLVAAW